TGDYHREPRDKNYRLFDSLISPLHNMNYTRATYNIAMWIKDYVWHKLLKRPYKLSKVIDLGDGDETIVLVHGLASKSQIWLPLVELLDKSRYRIISYDLLGFGSSPKPESSSYSTKDHAKSIYHSIKKDIKTGQKVILVGHSMGCIISTYLAYNYEGLVKNLILYQPPLLLEESEKRSFHRKLYTYIARKPPLFLNYVKFVNRLFRNKLENLETATSNWTSIEKSIHNTILSQETIFELKNLSIPTDVVYGKMDFVVSRLDAKKLAGINKNIKLHYVYEMHDITKRSSKYLKALLERV
ncbi:MAG TPA: alpha/beta hydrolase, partial [Candidatus Saccharimonadales bacterium]|nr:alpha/beta hydrolase [Candidatus Saccharimonadales bacterium]